MNTPQSEIRTKKRKVEGVEVRIKKTRARPSAKFIDEEACESDEGGAISLSGDESLSSHDEFDFDDSFVNDTSTISFERHIYVPAPSQFTPGMKLPSAEAIRQYEEEIRMEAGSDYDSSFISQGKSSVC